MTEPSLAQVVAKKTGSDVPFVRATWRAHEKAIAAAENPEQALEEAVLLAGMELDGLAASEEDDALAASGGITAEPRSMPPGPFTVVAITADEVRAGNIFNELLERGLLWQEKLFEERCAGELVIYGRCVVGKLQPASGLVLPS